MSKAREFWICQKSGYKNQATVWGAQDTRKNEGIHVIEYKAYEAAVKALKALVNSQVVKQAPFIGYSEAYLIAVQTLKELGEHE